MRAAVLHAFGSKLTIEDIPEPVAGPGEAVVEVLATRVLSYWDVVVSGARRYLMEPPFVPGVGCIGRIRALGPDATRLAIGDHVVCDPTVRSRDAGHAPDILLQGLTAGGSGGLVLQRRFHDGSFAEAMRVPLENAVPIGTIDAAEAGHWCALLMLMVPYGGLLAGEVQPGETVVVNGATGGFGSAGIAVALGMGAARIIATGRNRSALAMLARRYGARVVPVAMTGDEAADRAAITAAGPPDCVLDLLPPMAAPSQVHAAALAVRPGGRVVLMGGLADKEVALPYGWLMRNNITLRGQWMYPRDAVPRMISMIRAGLVSLDEFEITEFPLSEVEAAMAHAASHAGPLQQTVLLPHAKA
jgi:alcohol dehydrogenase